MKNLIFFLLFLLTLQTTAQNTYTEAIQQGDHALSQGQYKTAINKYFSAEAVDSSKKQTVQEKVNAVFDKMEVLMLQREEETQAALQKADKLMNAFYFYEGRFALAADEKDGVDVFFFMDKNGDKVDKLGRWQKAEQFDGSGFTKIQNQGKDYLLDTFGQLHAVAYDIKGVNVNVKATALNLSDSNMKELPVEIGQLQALTKLDLGYNDLSKLPPEIGQLQQLIDLDLGHNNLKILPFEIGELKALMNLNASHNDLGKLPYEIGQLQALTILDLSGNDLRELPVEMGQLKELTDLNLRRNDLSELPAEMGQWKKMTTLDLGRNNLSELPAEICQLHQLTILNLRRNNLSELPAGIEQLKQLRELNLEKNGITEEEQVKIQQLLPNCEVRF